jgi:peroxiredoxin
MAFTLEIGQPAPHFDLPGVDDRRYSLASFTDAPVLVIAFWCNHCPYVIGSEERMKRFVADYAPRGVAIVAINSNETENHPGDSFDKMIERSRHQRYDFPYLRDETQEVARAYGALRTPHFFVFDQERKLRYTGRMDDNPRTPGMEKTRELCDAVDALLGGKTVAVAVTNPIGCNVKWWGKPEKWMPPEACDLV